MTDTSPERVAALKKAWEIEHAPKTAATDAVRDLLAKVAELEAEDQRHWVVHKAGAESIKALDMLVVEKDERIAELEETNACLVDQAGCWYEADGSITRMHAADVIHRRKAAARKIGKALALFDDYHEGGVNQPSLLVSVEEVLR